MTASCVKVHVHISGQVQCSLSRIAYLDLQLEYHCVVMTTLQIFTAADLTFKDPDDDGEQE